MLESNKDEAEQVSLLLHVNAIEGSVLCFLRAQLFVAAF